VPLTASLTLCQYCDHANPADANFCIGCGAQLHLVPCPTCGAVNPKTSKTCYQCHGELRESTEILLARLPDSNAEAAEGTAASTAMSTTYTAQTATTQRQPIYVIVIILLAFAAAAFFAYQQRGSVAEKRAASEVQTKTAPVKAPEPSPANVSAGAISKGTVVAPPVVPANIAPKTVPPAPEKDLTTERAAIPIEAKTEKLRDAPDTARPGTIPPSTTPRFGARQQPVTPSAVSKATDTKLSPPVTCTEGIAALGLCTPGPTKGNP
jgi:hypothetical protein